MHLQERYLARELSPDNVESLLFGQEVESAVRHAPEKKSQKGDEGPSTECRKNVIEIGVPNTHGSAYMGFRYMGFFWWFFGYIIIWKTFSLTDFLEIWSFRLYSQILEDKTVAHTSGTGCTFDDKS